MCAEQAKQTTDGCFRLVGPHQHHVCLVALRQLTLYIHVHVYVVINVKYTVFLHHESGSHPVLCVMWMFSSGELDILWTRECSTFKPTLHSIYV